MKESCKVVLENRGGESDNSDDGTAKPTNRPNGESR
jgi:hypothetical protein